MNAETEQRDDDTRRKVPSADSHAFPEGPPFGESRQSNHEPQPRAKRRVHAGRHAEQHGPGPERARAKQADDQHKPRQGDRAVGVLGPHQQNGIHDAALIDGATERDQERASDGQPRAMAHREDDERDRLKGDHADRPAQPQRQLHLGDAGPQRHGAELMEQRPQFDVIDVERVVRRVGDEPGDDLRRLDRDMPGWKTDISDPEAEDPAGNQHPPQPETRRH